MDDDPRVAQLLDGNTWERCCIRDKILMISCKSQEKCEKQGSYLENIKYIKCMIINRQIDFWIPRIQSS